MRRRQRRRRGAAMVEAVVAIPFFIIIFASMLYVGKLYAQKQRTMRQAKQQAWAFALNNCEGSAGGATKQSGGNPLSQLNPPPKGGNVNLGKGGKYAGDSGGGSMTKNWGTASATVKATVVADHIIGGYSKKLSTTTRMQCNEKPAKGSIMAVLEGAWHEFTIW